MTSNIGSEHLTEMQPMGFENGQQNKEQARQASAKDKIFKALKESFRPEFLNRIDEIIIFNYLNRKEIRQIVDLELKKIEDRLQKAKAIKIDFSNSLKEHLAEKGFDVNLGARPLKRVIQKIIIDPLSLRIITGQIQPKHRVSVDFKADKVIFGDEKKPKLATAR